MSRGALRLRPHSNPSLPIHPVGLDIMIPRPLLTLSRRTLRRRCSWHPSSQHGVFGGGEADPHLSCERRGAASLGQSKVRDGDGWIIYFRLLPKSAPLAGPSVRHVALLLTLDDTPLQSRYCISRAQIYAILENRDSMRYHKIPKGVPWVLAFKRSA